MRTSSMLRRVLLGLMIVISLHAANAKMSDHEIVTKGSELVEHGADFLSRINEIISPIESFAKISKFLTDLGPVAMGVSSMLSKIATLLPQDDSPELQAIKKGFEVVNDKLDIITSKIGSLENVIELSSAKSVFIDSVTAINSNFEALESARRSDNKKNYQFFAKQYDNTFALATDKIYNSLVGSHGSMGFDMINLYKIHVKCNPQMLSDFCTRGLQLIVQGMDIEGAYMGFNNFSERAKDKAETWKPKLDNLAKHCSVRIEECENGWKTYAYQQFRESFGEIGGDNQAFAERLAKEMHNLAPQRSWLTVVYNDAGGFGPHTYAVPNSIEVETIWHEKNKCATLVSVPKVETLKGDNYKYIVENVEKQQRVVEAINHCRRKPNWMAPTDIYKDNHARFIVQKISERYQQGLIYAINFDHNPGYFITGGTFFATTVRWQCTKSPFKLLIFQ